MNDLLLEVGEEKRAVPYCHRPQQPAAAQGARARAAPAFTLASRCSFINMGKWNSRRRRPSRKTNNSLGGGRAVLYLTVIEADPELK